MQRILLILLIGFAQLNGFGQTFTVSPFEIDLSGNVFAPAYFHDNVVICGDRKDRIFKTVKDEHNNEPVDLYIFNPENPDSVSRFNEKFRTIYHDGPISFSKDGKLAVVSRNLLTDQKYKQLQKETNHLGLYFTEMTDTGWTELKPLPYNSTEFNCSHPTLSRGGFELYFSSNMPGGQGGYDLWKCYLEDGQWSKPRNLGPAVNTEKDEIFPCLDGEKLYFSSDRGEYGGLDLYLANSSDLEMAPKALDTSFNSSADDFAMVSNDEMYNGYFTSNRTGTDQLYKFEYDYPVFGPCDTLIETFFCYTLEEEYSMEHGEVEALRYFWNVNGEKIEGFTIEYCFPGPGDYEITLDIMDTIINKTYYEQSYYYISLALEEQPYISAPDTVLPGQEFFLSAEKTNLPNLQIEEEDYYWLIDGKHYRGIDVWHTFEKTGTYEIQLGVIGLDGEIEVQECVYRGIVVADTTFTDQDMVAFNDKDEIPTSDATYNDPNYADATDENAVFTIEVASSEGKELPEDHYIFKILELNNIDYELEFIEEKDLYVYLVGSYEDLTKAYPDWLDLQKFGLEDAVVRAIDLENFAGLELNESFVFENIQFDSDSWKLRPESKTSINGIIKIMEMFPEFKLEIGAHTDNTASAEHNLKLSRSRAKSVYQYMIEKGIKKDRIKYEGFGEANPIDTNDTEEGKQNNRRVEFTIIKV